MRDKSCILCEKGNADIETYIKHKSFNIFYCKNCGLYFQSTDGQFETLKNIYNNIYDSSPIRIQNKFYWNQRLKTHYDDILAFHEQKGTLLDIGCSYGMLMEYFISKGWNVTGFDISKNAANYAKSRGLNCHNTTIENFKTEKKFDVIVMSNVLEHLENPLISLGIIKNWLSDNGIIYIRVPNVESVILLSKRQSFLGDLKPFEHFFYFSKNTLGTLIEKAGLKSFIKTDGRNNLSNVINCYTRSKFVLSDSWQNLNFKTKTKEKKGYLLLKHIYGEILLLMEYFPLGKKNREVVAFAGKRDLFVVK